MAKTYASILFRAVVAMATIPAAIVMIIADSKTNNQKLSCIDGNLHMWNVFFIAVQFIAFGFNVLGILMPSNSGLWSLVFFLDLAIVMPMQFMSWTSTMVCYQYMKSGNPYACCRSECNSVDGLCDLVFGALVAGGFATFSSFLFHGYSSQKTFNYLDVPPTAV